MSKYGEQIGKTTVRFQRMLPGPIERIWAWITEEEKRRQWFAAGETELRVGGKAELHFNNSSLTTPDDEPPEKFKPYAGDLRFVGEVLEVDPPRLIRFSWPEEDGTSSEATFELETAGDKVILTLTHEKLETRDSMVNVSAGWHTHLDLLEAKLGGPAPTTFWSKIIALETDYDGRLPR